MLIWNSNFRTKSFAKALRRSAGRWLPAALALVTVSTTTTGIGSEEQLGSASVYLAQAGSSGSTGFIQHLDPIDRIFIDGGDTWTTGDFNADGKLDIYFWWAVAGTNRLYLSNGDGTFTQHLDPVDRTFIDGCDTWTTGDFSGDGKTDVLFWWSAAGTNRLYLSSVDGAITKNWTPTVEKLNSFAFSRCFFKEIPPGTDISWLKFTEICPVPRETDEPRLASG